MNSPALPRIFLFRHGETEWSRSGQHTGRTEIPLTSRGEDEARALRLKIEATAFTQVLVSPRARARRTSELAGLGGAAVVEPLLQEWDYGDFEGLTSTQILERAPRWNLFLDGCPNGESPSQVVARADTLLTRLRSAEGNIALVSHGHFLRTLGARWVGWPVEAAQRLFLQTASISILSHEHQRANEPVIEAWNAR